MAFVCAFRGARDRYQAPIALAEADQLERFITDAYVTPAVKPLLPFLPPAARAAIAGRHADGIPDSVVDCLWATTVVEHTRHRLGLSKRITWLRLDRRFSEAAAARARASRADLFLYNSYAWEAFVAKYAHTPKRVLFQYHPHADLETRVLADDAKRFPGYGESFSSAPENVPEDLLRGERDSWQHADVIVCASAFTRRSLVEAGCDERKCRVVPYGIDLPAAPAAAPGDRFRVLFVGSGGQRKGLHHLLMAWRNASLPKGSELTLVCRVMDRKIEELARSTPGVEIVPGAAYQQIERLYAGSTLFAMPSMVEGFGQVYLEALAEGCPVLGTPNTCLPDLGGEADGVFVCEPGNVEALTERLRDLSTRLPGSTAIRSAARATAARFPWSAFRASLRGAVNA